MLNLTLKIILMYRGIFFLFCNFICDNMNTTFMYNGFMFLSKAMHLFIYLYIIIEVW